MDVAAPTPVAAFVHIEPVVAYTYGAETGTLSSFRIDFTVTNIGTRTIFADLRNYRIEKLVDQKWVEAYVQTGPQFQSVRNIGVNRSIILSANAFYSVGTEPAWPLIEHIRGLYRVRFYLAFAGDGTQAILESDSYSQPFVVQ